jgi:hypothetical protein
MSESPTPQPYRSLGFAIIGPYNTIWTDKLFDDPAAARKYIDDFWRNIPDSGKGYSLAPATLIVEVSGPERIPLDPSPDTTQ